MPSHTLVVTWNAGHSGSNTTLELGVTVSTFAVPCWPRNQGGHWHTLLFTSYDATCSSSPDSSSAMVLRSRSPAPTLTSFTPTMLLDPSRCQSANVAVAGRLTAYCSSKPLACS